MGHNRAPKEGNRCCRAGVYFTREDYESIKLAAKDRELSISEFVRSAAVERAKVQEILRASEREKSCHAEVSHNVYELEAETP
jgi:uncharacterized protein (DUF1778 family)